MKTSLRILLLLAIAQFSFAQTPSAPIPVCNGSNGPNCTDYFGVANWANSPLPAGSVTSLTLVAGGSGYSSAPTVQITDLANSGTGATASVNVMSGVISGITLGSGGTGYIMPQVVISDPTGSGAMATAVIGGTLTGGMKKFIDPIVDLKSAIATADTTTFPNSDYYEIALVQYSQKMSSSLPDTTLRGYVQVPTGSAGCSAALAATPNYLGPVILAQKNRPVRVKFINCLPAGKDLFIPVDTTYMGAGMNAQGGMYSDSRATLHLHGGATPWISDGTPHQWTVPVGDSATNQKGDSVAYVPDMWFDATTGAVIPSCAAHPTCSVANASNNPGPGALSFFWTNEQGGRLMFYHDHAYGLTRLNVYAGEAAGYLLYDPTEESTLLNATAPGSIATNATQTAPDLGHLIPLVLQDKTFVPTPGEIDATDPTWRLNFGSNPGMDVTGDLWFPHVYTPNQNPNDPVGGANAFGRWDYGPWFFPPQTSLSAASAAGSTNGQTISCTSSAFPGTTLAPSASCPSCGCPITPNPSGTPEGFMDTPVVNGVAYPVMHVAPAAYRFKILSAGNDRSWNLSWFVADSTQNNTEVAMVPAAPPGAGSAIPLCSSINPVAVPALGLGLATALLDNNGNPLNGTGLPAGCWPNYGPLAGIPAPQTMWAADGRAGGAPDPRNAGPAWIQIGSEGGLLPAPVVIPPTPVNYEQNTRSITITNVAVHGLWLGPAERADVIVDFSKFAGKTLILYNDAPTPVPAFDSRVDYFTGDGDQTSIGGSPNTQPGYGPNTRTIMQVVVDQTAPNTQPFSLPALKAAFASSSTTQGVFAQTQPTPIVPEPAYNSAYNGIFGNAPVNNVPIAATTFTFTPYVAQAFDASCGTNCDVLGQKTIQELFTLDYGRMNATLGTELPNVNFTNQTTIPLGYVDPATEIIKQGNTQIWKITHNGVDTHFIHFHLFNVQVINRVGWDGSIRQIDPNEAGWKDTVRMNPLEDITVALQPITPALPFPIPNSVRLLDVTASAGSQGNPPFSNLDPYTNAGVNTVNALQNFGWEYVWHCHILGHEENDMMRPIIFQVPPAAPSNFVAAPDGTVQGLVHLAWTDNSASETGFVVQRDIDPTFPHPTLINVGPSATLNAAGEGTDWGGTIAVTDTPGNGTYYYRVLAIDDGWNLAKGLSQTYNASILGTLVSNWSNIATVGTAASATASPNPLDFGNVLVNTTSGALTVTISNASGAGTLAISGISIFGLNATDFSQTGTTCTASLASGASCTISVTFRPAAIGARTATLSITSSNAPSLSASLTGTGIASIISPSATSFSFGNVTVGMTSASQTLTLTNKGSSPLILSSIGFSGGNTGDFAIAGNTCTTGGTGLGLNGTCTITLAFKPTAIGNRSTVLAISSNDPATPTLNVSLSGFGTQSTAAVSPASLAFPVQLVNTTSAVQTVTLSNSGNVAFTINSITLTGTNSTEFVLSNGCGASVAAGGNCILGVSFRPAGSGSRTATVNISTTANVNPNPTVVLKGTGTQVNLDATVITFAPQAIGTQSASQSVTLTNTGPAALRITAVGLTGANPGDFSQTNNCPIGGSLGAGGSCRANVRFTPTAVGTRTATLSITTNDLGTPTATVALSGIGVQALATLTPTSHSFGTVKARTNSAPFAFTFQNTGSAVVTISSISFGGANANRFSQTNNCGASLAIGASCTINVTFSPQQAGSYSATLQVRDNAAGSPQSATLTGIGN